MEDGRQELEDGREQSHEPEMNLEDLERVFGLKESVGESMNVSAHCPSILRVFRSGNRRTEGNLVEIRNFFQNVLALTALQREALTTSDGPMVGKCRYWGGKRISKLLVMLFDRLIFVATSSGIFQNTGGTRDISSRFLIIQEIRSSCPTFFLCSLMFHGSLLNSIAF